MTTRGHDDLERTLDAARVETTPEQDARVLDAAGRALRRRRWLPLAAAASLLALAAGLGWALLAGGADAEDPTDVVVARTLPPQGQEELATNYSSDEATVLQVDRIAGGGGGGGGSREALLNRSFGAMTIRQ